MSVRERWSTAVLLVMALASGASAHAASSAFDIEGHRGARGLAPENTLTAFRRALDIGVTTIETDVAITRDGVPVISHDPMLNPDLVRDKSGAWITRRDIPIHSLSLAELREYDIGRIDPQTAYAKGLSLQRPADGERFPTLAQLLELVRASGKPVRLNIETKITPDNAGQTVDPATFVRLIIDEVQRAGLVDRVIIQSFDWRSLVESKRIAPEVPTSCLSIEASSMNTMLATKDGVSPWHAGLSLAEHGSVPALVKAAGCAIWSPFYRNVTPALVTQSHALGLQVIPWTVNDEAEMRRLIDLGVDGLITDYPDRLHNVAKAKALPLPQ
ncbi:MAG TPA: glycerophosphodiester phosphodiesterase [Casimicrobiaceae bacterium]|nr:glycerophosphodiester phosphodiesterase [Casimicrobiaceae bacterium]